MKLLPWLNLFGVLLLAALCLVQWQRDRRLNLEVNALQKARHAHEEKIAEQEKAMRGLNGDVEHFKQQAQAARTELADARGALGKIEREQSQLRNERDQLRTSVTDWAQAVAERDARLREANEQLRDLSARLNESVQKFNELATNYNIANRRFNELGSNYNSVVTQLNTLRTSKDR